MGLIGLVPMGDAGDAFDVDADIDFHGSARLVGRKCGSIPTAGGWPRSPRSRILSTIPIRHMPGNAPSVPVFYWEEYGYWCFARHDDVSALLRDRRFGRQILHLISREDSAGPKSRRTWHHSTRSSSNRCWRVEPPVHTRLRGLVNRAFLSRQVERLRRPSPPLSHRADRWLRGKARGRSARGVRDAHAGHGHRRSVGVPAEGARALLAWSHDMVAMYQARRKAVEDAAVAATLAFREFMRDRVRGGAGVERPTISALIARRRKGRSSAKTNS